MKTQADWTAIRDAFEGGETILALVRRFGVARNTIRRRIRGEGWTLRPEAVDRAINHAVQESNATSQQVAAATKANVIAIGTKRAFEAQSSKVREQVAETLEDLLQRQLPLAAKATAFAESVLTRAESGELQPTAKEGWSGFASGIVNAAAKAAELTREIAGLKSGTPSVKLSQKTIQRRFIIQTPEPAKQPKPEAAVS